MKKTYEFPMMEDVPNNEWNKWERDQGSTLGTAAIVEYLKQCIQWLFSSQSPTRLDTDGCVPVRYGDALWEIQQIGDNLTKMAHKKNAKLTIIIECEE